MDIRIDNFEDSMVLVLSGRFDADISLRLGERIEFEIEGRKGDGSIDFDVFMDLADVPYVSSGGIRVLLSLHKMLDAAGRRFALCDLQPMVARVINVSGLFGLFNIYASVEDAIAASRCRGPADAVSTAANDPQNHERGRRLNSEEKS